METTKFTKIETTQIMEHKNRNNIDHRTQKWKQHSSQNKNRNNTDHRTQK